MIVVADLLCLGVVFIDLVYDRFGLRCVWVCFSDCSRAYLVWCCVLVAVDGVLGCLGFV